MVIHNKIFTKKFLDLQNIELLNNPYLTYPPGMIELRHYVVEYCFETKPTTAAHFSPRRVGAFAVPGNKRAIKHIFPQVNQSPPSWRAFCLPDA